MQTLKLTKIKADPSQPRQSFDPADMELLKASIASQGIRQPLVVEKIKGNGHYLLVDGERRFRAATQLKLKEVPVVVEEPMSDFKRLIIRFHLQQQHRNWTYFDQARAVKVMIDLGELTQKEIPAVLGLSSRTVADMLALLSMSKRTQEVIGTKRIPYEYVIRLNSVLNKVKNEQLRPKVEDALMKQIESGKIKTGKSMTDYGYAIKKGGDKIAKKIIKESTYTSNKALKDAKAEDYQAYKRLMAGINWLIANASSATKLKGYKYVDKRDLGQLKRARAYLGDFIKPAEANQE